MTVLEKHLPDGNSMAVFSPSPAAPCVPKPHPRSLPTSEQASIQPKDKSRTLRTAHSYSLIIDLDSPSALLGPATAASAGSWLEMQSQHHAQISWVRLCILTWSLGDLCAPWIWEALFSGTHCSSSLWFSDGACLEAPSSQISEERQNL